jgi:hypothetical protein
VSAVIYTCGKEVPDDWRTVLLDHPTWADFYKRIATKLIFSDETIKPEEKEYVFQVRLSPECPKGEDYAWFAMAVFLSNGECRWIVMLPQSPNVIEEYGPCPPGVRPPEGAVGAR